MINVKQKQPCQTCLRIRQKVLGIGQRLIAPIAPRTAPTLEAKSEAKTPADKR